MMDAQIINAGDVVVCIDARAPVPIVPKQLVVLGRIKQRATYRVTRVVWLDGERGLHLLGVDHRPTEGWRANRFRKVLPADDAFCEAIKRRALEFI